MIPLSLRASGRIAAIFACSPEGETRIVSLEEAGGYRMRLARRQPRRPGVEAVSEGMLVNTGGGMAAGDRLSISVEAGPGTRVVLSTLSAERIYGSAGDDTAVTTTLRADEGACIAWLPRETILYDGAQLRRRLEVEIAPDATLILVEMTVFGRLAMGETMRAGLFSDHWRIRRGGRLVHAEEARLEGQVGALLDRRALGDGARAVATALMVSPQAEDRLDAVRLCLERSECEAGASAWGGRLVARFLAQDAGALRRALVPLMHTLTRRPPPHGWAGYECEPQDMRAEIERGAVPMPDWRWRVARESQVASDSA